VTTTFGLQLPICLRPCFHGSVAQLPLEEVASYDCLTYTQSTLICITIAEPPIAKTVCVLMRNAGGERGGGGTRKQTDEVGLLDYT
jgi:hypothetical protein